MGRALIDNRTILGSSPVTKAFNYTYNLDGSMATLKYPSGRIITYTPSAAGRMVSATDLANSISYATAASYVPSGTLSQYTLGGSINGFVTYNSRLQPLQVFYGTNTPAAGTLQSLTCPATVGNLMHRVYVFGAGTNDNGNVQSIKNCRDTNRTQNFQYDALNRIKQAATQGANWGEAFTIDAWANLTNKDTVSGKLNPEPFAAPADVNNRLTGYVYDAAGNMTGNNPYSYAFDAENRMKTTTNAGVTRTYVYDGDGRRVKKSSNATNGILYWAGMGSDPLLESSLSGGNTGEYIFFNGKRVARRDVSGGVVHYYYSDHLGSASVITSSAGVIQEESDYYPYGGEGVITNSDPNHYKFNGKERDTESGLDEFGARYYASAFGRFIQPIRSSPSI